jgi:hypothetical protein
VPIVKGEAIPLRHGTVRLHSVFVGYEQLFRSSPEAVLAIYRLVDLTLLLTGAGIERVRAPFGVLGIKRKHPGESIMRRTAVNAKG